MTHAAKWPKQLAPLTDEQKRISDEFMHLWHEVLPKKYGLIEHFNHTYALKSLPAGNARCTTLEIGAGIGGHLSYEPLQRQDYHAIEIRPDMAATLKKTYPQCHVTVGDCQQRIDFPDQYFDRVLAIHVLEHLPNLPAALREIYRVIKPGGVLSVVIPCEGGMAYSLARNISARRLFEKKFNQPYDWFISREHLNVPQEILTELEPMFIRTHQQFFPLLIPSVEMNLCLGLTFTPKSHAR